MATKKGAAKKGASKKGASKSSGLAAGAGVIIGDRVSFDKATAQIAQAVRRAVASQPTLSSKLKNPIIVGIWYNPKTKQVEIINQLEQF